MDSSVASSPHVIRLGAPAGLGAGAAPLILQRSDDDFITAVLDELRSPQGRTRLLASRANARAGQVLKLFQPVQRQHHLLLLRAWCDEPGTPRIDPSRVESAGLVVRRVRRGAQAVHEGWMRSRGEARGWLSLQRIGGPAHEPDAQRRLLLGRTGVADVDQALIALDAQREDSALNEHVLPLFVAPPDVCQATGQTLFYGLVPTISGERAPGAAPFDEDGRFGPDSSDFRQHLVQALRGEHMDFALAGESVQTAWAEAAEIATDSKPAGLSSEHWNRLRPGGAHRTAMQRLLRLLRQLVIECDAIDGTHATAQALRAQLAAITLPLPQREGETTARSSSAEAFVRAAARVLVERDPNAPRPEMPTHWPALGSVQAQALRRALHAALAQRFAQLNAAPGRFDDASARYVLRCFVRLKPECGCPARTVWSAESEPFVIAPWYEAAGAPPARIDLPDLSDRNLLKSLKPNVSFAVPPALQGLLAGNPKDLMEGKGGGTPLGIGWICSFSIPVITFCAFIVLSIFLGLFDLIFRWLAFIKICLPFPKKGDS
jgi:hypothetical protein